MGIAAASVVSIVLFIALGSGLDVFLDLLIGIFYIYAAFRSRAMLEDHFTAKGVTDFRLNGVWTFFFSHFYLQYKINQGHDVGILQQPGSLPSVQDLAPELRELARLHQQDILTDEEYERKRSQLLDQL